MASLSWSERRFLVLIGTPALGLTLMVTVVSTYLPVVIAHNSGPIIVGLLIGGEGFFGIGTPAVVGALTDKNSRTVGGRLRFCYIAAALSAATLVVVGLLHSVVAIGVAIAVFYIGYYAYLAPYWALYPDLVPKEQSGRSRGAESTWRVLGSGIALISGGFLLSVWRPLPFLLAAGVLLLVTAVLRYSVHDRLDQRLRRNSTSIRETFAEIWDMWSDSAEVRRLTVATAMWTFVLSALRAFVVLFFTVGMHRPTHFVSAVIFPLAVVGFVCAPLSGMMADRFGFRPVLTGALVVYGVGLLLPWITHSPYLLVLIPFVAGGAATVMTLPYAALMRLLGEEEGHGAASGLFGFARGVGGFLGPILVGVAIALLRHVPTFSDTKGYDALWLVIGSVTLLSLLLVRRLHVPGNS